MGLADTAKHAAKTALDALTGGAAVVTLRWDGPPAPDALITVHVTVTSTGREVHATGAVIDLHGEDDLDEALLDRLAELLPGEADPHHTLRVADAFTLAPDQTKTFVATFHLPALTLGRSWLIRARVEVPGRDAASPYERFA